MAGHPLRPATRRRLGEPLPHQQADRPRVHPRPKNFPPKTMRFQVLSGISSDFSGLSQSPGQVTHVLLTRSPLIPGASTGSSFDLHVLSTPPAFVLSQDQTLQKNWFQHPPKEALRASITDRETTDYPKSNCPSIKGIHTHPKKRDRLGFNKIGIEHSARC